MLSTSWKREAPSEELPRWAALSRMTKRKYRHRDGDACAGSRGSDLLVSSAEGMTLDEVDNNLVYGMSRAQIMEYLSQTYGPVFVGDLMKHLPQLG